MPDDAGRLAGLLLVRRTAGRDFGTDIFGRDIADFGLVIAAAGLAIEPESAELLAAVLPVLLVVLAVLVVRALDLAGLEPEADIGRVDAVLDRAAGLRLAVVRGLAADVALAMTGFTDDMDLAAAVRALAAIDMALVAVFIACMAEDMVLAPAVALVAAAVIFVAADVTLVAADETVLAAAAGVAELRLPLALVRLPVLRLPELRPLVLARLPVLRRAAVDRDAVLRADRAVVLRVVDFAAVLLAGFAAELRVAIAMPLEVLDDIDLGRLAVPRDALRLTDLLRAALAELRRVAARVVD